MSFASGLKQKRIERDMSQEDIALALKVSQKTVSSWETGRTIPNMGYIENICKTLDCTTEDLIGVKERQVGDISYEDIIVKINSLDMQSLCALKEVIDRKIRYIYELHELEIQKREFEERTQALQAEIERLKRESK